MCYRGIWPMTRKITIAGKQMEPNALYAWALGSMTRALFFYGQAVSEKKNKILCAISAYYSLFHLTMAIGLLCPSLIPDKDLKDINERLEGGLTDPSSHLSHKKMKAWMNIFIQKGLPKDLLHALETAEMIRSFVNYGPRTKWEGGDIIINTCKTTPETLDRLVDKLPELIEHFITWGCKNGENNGIWVESALSRAEFPANFYKEWSTPKVVNIWHKFRKKLIKKARSIVYKK